MKLWKTLQLAWHIVNQPTLRLGEVSNAEQEKWLAELWLSRAFQSYCAAREKKLKDFLADGSGLKPHPRDDYQIAYGQLLELRTFRKHSETCYNSMQKKLKEMKKSSALSLTG